MKRSHYYSLLGALLLALLVRVPGVLWGYNFPWGWWVHHPDEWSHIVNTEVLIDPSTPPRWYHPYPKGMAAHVAAPMIAVRAAQGRLSDAPPGLISITVVGRAVSVLYGVATVLVTFLLARRLFRDPRVGVVAVWILALGGLHISQSHFFLADVPGLFWFLLSTYLLLLAVGRPEQGLAPFLMAAAFCSGVAFGIKLTMIGLPTLAIVALMHRPRVTRAAYVAVFFVAGLTLVNMSSYTAYDIFNTLARGTTDPCLKKPWASFLLYLVQLPSLVSLPVVLLAIGGCFLLARKLFSPHSRSRLWPTAVTVLMPLVIHALLVIIRLDHFPRHFVPFIPWISLVAAYGLVRIIDWFILKRLHLGLIVIPVFVYLALFVYDGERLYIQEPRNEAAEWILQNVAPGKSYSWRTHNNLEGYEPVYFPDMGKPDVIVIEMHHANHYLSGMGLKNSFPRDYRYIFDSKSQEHVDARQALFEGTSEYKEAARFSEDYFMPEFVLVDELIGNRSRNYIAEIVIFAKASEPD